MTDYKKLYFQEKKKTKYAWGQYFQMRNELFEFQLDIYNEVEEVGGENLNDAHQETNQHLMKFIKELYKESKKKVECPVCLEVIDPDDLETTPCGHNFHKNCLDEVKAQVNNKFYDCPVCRKKLYKK